MSIQNEPLVISIDESGNYFINVGEESLAINLEELKRKSKVIYDANPEIEVVFQSDKDVSFDFVAKAMASVQSVGISKIGIVTSGYEINKTYLEASFISFVFHGLIIIYLLAFLF